jgi:hypothetical protein
MVLLTKAQRHALFRLFRRDFPSWVIPFKRQNNITRDFLRRLMRGLGPFLPDSGSLRPCGSGWAKHEIECPGCPPLSRTGLMLFDCWAVDGL